MASRNNHAVRSSCPIACGLDVLGDHWTLLIIRDLLFFDRHEFGELLASPEGISTNILSNRLQQLQQNDIIRFVRHPEDQKRKLYYLTPKGKSLVNIIVSVGQWSLQYMPDTARAFAVITANFGDDPATLIRNVYAHLDDWEKKYLPSHT